MKSTLKKMAFVLSLGLGLGMSGSVSAYAAAGDGQCDIWAAKCADGNERACLLWDINCYSYEG